MKRTKPSLVSKSLRAVAVAVAVACSESHALVIPGATGADGTFAPQSNTTVDLSLAATRAWDEAPAQVGRGVYDPEKWAVVFKYNSVIIPSGVTVTFANNASRAPVVWLVNGTVTINGTIRLNASNGFDPGIPAEPGPGGFRGGIGTIESGSGGFGPGGGRRSTGLSTWAIAAFGSPALPHPDTAEYTTFSGDVYGNSRLLPLIGGSGSSLSFRWNPSHHISGGAGGGAILIAASGRITVNGQIQATGSRGTGPYEVERSGGSGGAIRLIGDEIGGSGILDARGFSLGGAGRIRVEANAFFGNLNVVPATGLAQPDDPVLIWPPNTAPTATIVAVSGQNTPADPKARLNPQGAPDVTLTAAGIAEVIVETRNFPVNGTVLVRVVPLNGEPQVLNAALVSGDAAQARWRAEANLGFGYAAMQARAISP